jgi:hypothetical protein
MLAKFRKSGNSMDKLPLLFLPQKSLAFKFLSLYNFDKLGQRT